MALLTKDQLIEATFGIFIDVYGYQIKARYQGSLILAFSTFFNRSEHTGPELGRFVQKVQKVNFCKM